MNFGMQNTESFYHILREKNPDYANRLDQMKQIGLRDWLPLIRPDKGSHAGYTHLQNVERNADKCIPDSIKREFSAGEIYLLLCSIFLHDVGRMVPKYESPDDKGVRPQKAKGYCHERKCNKTKRIVLNYYKADYADKLPLCKRPQWDHFIESERIIKESWPILGLPDQKFAEYCGLIVFCHCLRKPPKETQYAFPDEAKCIGIHPKKNNYRETSLEPYGLLRIPILAAILRIADEADNSWPRAINENWLEIYKKNNKDVGKSFRKYVEDVEFCHSGRCIILHIPDGQIGLLDNLKRLDDITENIREVAGIWGKDFMELDVFLDKVVIEYDNKLYDRLLRKDGKGKNVPPTLTELFPDDKDIIQKLFDALTQLYFGTWRCKEFYWKSIEAKVGQPLSEYHKWLTQRIGNANPDFAIGFNHDRTKVSIEVSCDDMVRIREGI